ncbi:hypothetical protein BJX63DRAFT_118250 [Aspergillus granulosus]|uniref:Uncharacterized protein n=1 Tax=Aspergillus granulosus TaxID=176169 RepID=A0ABR4HR70_9EURO
MASCKRRAGLSLEFVTLRPRSEEKGSEGPERERGPRQQTPANTSASPPKLCQKGSRTDLVFGGQLGTLIMEDLTNSPRQHPALISKFSRQARRKRIFRRGEKCTGHPTFRLEILVEFGPQVTLKCRPSRATIPVTAVSTAFSGIQARLPHRLSSILPREVLGPSPYLPDVS